MKPPIALVLLSVALAAGCPSAPVELGPVSLRDARHMSDYLCGAEVWKLWYQKTPVQFWMFRPDGTFSVWIEQPAESDLTELFPGHGLPNGVQELSGKWQATKTELELSELKTGKDESVEPFTLNLNWVDGKLRIEIGGHHYMRRRMPVP